MTADDRRDPDTPSDDMWDEGKEGTRGPEPAERLKLDEADWTEAVRKMMRKGRSSKADVMDDGT